MNKINIIPVCLLICDSNKDIDNYIFEIEDRALNNLARGDDFVRTSYFADEINFSDIVSDLNTYPMFSAYKVIRVYSAEKIPFGDLAFYIRNPSVFSLLILISFSLKKNWDKNILSLIEDIGFIKEINKPRVSNVKFLLTRRFNDLHIKFDNEVLDFLTDYVDFYSFDKLFSEISLLWDRDKILTFDDVLGFVSEYSENTVFDFIDCLFNKKMAKSLYMLHVIYFSKEFYPPLILNLIYRQFKLLWNYLVFSKNKKVNDYEFAKKMGVFLFVLKKISNQSKNYSLKILSDNITKLSKLELKIKSVSSEITLFYIESYVIEFCSS